MTCHSSLSFYIKCCIPINFCSFRDEQLCNGIHFLYEFKYIQVFLFKIIRHNYMD